MWKLIIMYTQIWIWSNVACMTALLRLGDWWGQMWRIAASLHKREQLTHYTGTEKGAHLLHTHLGLHYFSYIDLNEKFNLIWLWRFPVDIQLSPAQLSVCKMCQHLFLTFENFSWLRAITPSPGWKVKMEPKSASHRPQIKPLQNVLRFQIHKRLLEPCLVPSPTRTNVVARA